MARFGFELEQLKGLTPGERYDLRRCLGASQILTMLVAYYLATVVIVMTWAFSTFQRNGGPIATGLTAFLLLSIAAVAFLIAWRCSLWVTSRWGEADRELGLMVRRVHVCAGGMAKGSAGRLRGRRELILLGRQVPGLLLRAESDPTAAAGLQADLREGADPRVACRQLLLSHLRGDLLDARIVLATDRPRSMASTIPQWIAQLAAMTPALLLVLGLLGYQADGGS